MKMVIESKAFAHNQTIPRRYTGDGEDVSPPLSWSSPPPETKELALVCDDPDAPSAEPWVHWVIYKIPVDATGLPEGVPRTPRLSSPAGALQGNNSWGTSGYRGPSPPKGHGLHHYHFKLYALSAPLDLEPSVDKAELLAAMSKRVLAEGELVGTYQR